MLKAKMMFLDGSLGRGVRKDVASSLSGKSCIVVAPPYMAEEWAHLLPDATVVTPQLFVKRWGEMRADVLVADTHKPLKTLSAFMLGEARRFKHVIGLL